MAAPSSSLIGSSGQAIGRLVALGVLPIIAASVAVSWFVAAPLARRWQRDRWHVAICLAVTAPILAVTLLREGWPQGVADDLGRAVTWWWHGWGDVVDDLVTDAEALLNLLLFVPAGLAWAATTRRHRRTLVALVAASFLIETVQALLALGAADTTDLVANSLGGAVGVGLAVVGASVWRRTKWSAEPSASGRSRRWKAGAAAAVVVAVVGAVLLVQWRADVARDDLLAELHRSYDGTTMTDMAPAFFDGTGNGYTEFLERNSVRPDSTRYSADQTRAQVRYSLMYFGLSRCVFVTWTSNNVVFRTDEGGICTDFLGQYLD